jgi:hypothetical protein
VRDATGVVPGVALTLTNEATAVSSTAVTNDAGEYAFANTPPGVYTIEARLAGYKTFERRGLVIGTQQTLVVDVGLDVGDIAEQITVTGETPALDRSSASVASIIDRSALENLPSTGRNPFLFSTTLPKVIPVGTPFFTRMQDQNASSLLSIAGAPPRANAYLLDGVPLTDLLNRAAMIPSNEALEEVSVQVNTYDASFGRNGGATFNATHRAGTNRWSGSGPGSQSAGLGPRRDVLRKPSEPAPADELQLPVGRQRGRPGRAWPHVRLRDDRRLQDSRNPRGGLDAPDRARARRRLFPQRGRGRAPHRHLRSAFDARRSAQSWAVDSRSFPRQYHSR